MTQFSDRDDKPEQLSRRKVMKLVAQRSLFAAFAGVLAAVTLKDPHVYASTLNGNATSTGGGWLCDCTSKTFSCYCNVPPPPR